MINDIILLSNRFNSRFEHKLYLARDYFNVKGQLKTTFYWMSSDEINAPRSVLLFGLNSFSAELFKVDSSMFKFGRLYFICYKSFVIFG